MPNKTEFLVRPNANFHQQSWKWAVVGLSVIALGIALRFAWLGYWMILPFAIIDVIAVTLIFMLVVRKSAYVEKIVVKQDWVEIHHIQRNHNANWQFPLHWARINLQRPRHHWYPHRLLLGSKGQWVEVGRCLTEDERQSLADALKKAITEFNHVLPA